MKLTEKQALYLWLVLADSLRIQDDVNPIVIFRVARERRIELAQEILDQQSEEIKDFSKEAD